MKVRLRESDVYDSSFWEGDGEAVYIMDGVTVAWIGDTSEGLTITFDKEYQVVRGIGTDIIVRDSEVPCLRNTGLN